MDRLTRQIKEAELEKLKSEIARNEAEKAKLMEEAKKERRGWFHRENLVKGGIGGIVAAGLLVTWSARPDVPKGIWPHR